MGPEDVKVTIIESLHIKSLAGNPRIKEAVEKADLLISEGVATQRGDYLQTFRKEPLITIAWRLYHYFPRLGADIKSVRYILGSNTKEINIDRTFLETINYFYRWYHIFFIPVFILFFFGGAIFVIDSISMIISHFSLSYISTLIFGIGVMVLPGLLYFWMYVRKTAPYREDKVISELKTLAKSYNNIVILYGERHSGKLVAMVEKLGLNVSVIKLKI